jgi:hypothetical protein
MDSVERPVSAMGSFDSSNSAFIIKVGNGWRTFEHDPPPFSPVRPVRKMVWTVSVRNRDSLRKWMGAQAELAMRCMQRAYAWRRATAPRCVGVHEVVLRNDSASATMHE